jgi:hypothetical protein
MELVNFVGTHKLISTEEDIHSLASVVANLPSAGVRYTHYIKNGLYVRKMEAPAGTMIIGKAHKESVMNIVMQGEAFINIGDNSFHVAAPFEFFSEKDTRKIGLAITDLVWVNIVKVDETDTLENIENRLYKEQ